MIDALYFGEVKDLYAKTGEKLTLTYYPGINEYMGKVTPQIIITHYQG